MGLIRILAGAVCLVLFAARAAAQPAPAVQPAIDGILAAFADHPLVGLGDAHDFAQEEDFYAALVCDPRFAETVRDIVVEFASAQTQAIVDRYVNGEDVPYSELRKVWTDRSGWVPGSARLGYVNFFAAVRAANASLPEDRRIRVWLGDPPIDWSQIHAKADWLPILRQREDHPADLIEREILAKGRRALVIYGGDHFFPADDGPLPLLGPLLAARHPGALFVILPYTGFNESGCSLAFEKTIRSWPQPALAMPVRGTSLEARLQRLDCHAAPPGRPLAAEGKYSGVSGDALLYLGPAANQRKSPMTPDIYLDAQYRAEIGRRYEIIMGKPMTKPTVADNPAALESFPSYRRR